MSSTSSTTELLLSDILPEFANTRRVLEALPDGEFSWKPHEKSMSLGALATHIANIGGLALAVLRGNELDLATLPSNQAPHANREAVLAELDGHIRELEAELPKLEEAALADEWTFRQGDHIIMQQPRAVVLRTLGVSHLIHHRAQLGVYLRMLDVPVPGVYGPSADEMAS